MDEKKIFNCFIASPGDTKEEREICEKVFSKINKGIGDAYGFSIQSLRWEHDVHPGIGEDGQDVVNKQVENKYDLFIGIMYTTFGTPTKRAGSGTEEEFYIAYKHATESKNLEIMFYFNDAPLKPSQMDSTQQQKVGEFRKNVIEKHCFYKMYNGIEDFEDKLTEDLNTYFHQLYSNQYTATNITRISSMLEERLNKALQLFEGQPKIWVDPIISSKNEISRNPNDDYDSRIKIEEIINNPSSYIISAPPQFGLTCLSHYMVFEAWKKGKLWIYIDAEKAKTLHMDKYIEKELSQLDVLDDKDIECLILDSWHPNEDGALKKLKTLCGLYPEKHIIVMRTLDDSRFLRGKKEDIPIKRQFTLLYLLALTRNQIRSVVEKYNSKAKIADDDVLLDKVVSDITTLNIHRTPQNCFTLLKVDEKKFDNNPVNRSQMLEDVLYVLFEFSEIPRYNTRPDVKDCQFVLGCFCEMLIRENRFTFSEDEFLRKTRESSASNMLNIDVKIVYEILFQNNIISEVDNLLTFKSAFWLFYFTARRMIANQDFANYIFETKKYLDYPEIMEFYTGVDRNRSDALGILHEDMHKTCEEVFTSMGISDKFNPYQSVCWHPNLEHIEQMQQELSDVVINSGLPNTIKDKYQDKAYNQLTPYNQNIVIHDFFEEYYVYNLMQEIKSSSRALRNSDYADVGIKKQLLNEILRGWLQISKVLFVLAPILAAQGRASYGGAGFLLSDDFGKTKDEREQNILFMILTNVVGFFKDDIYSSKISPLLYNAFENLSAHNALIKQKLALLFIICRPPKWYDYIDKYIISLSKNSFFLFEILNTLRAQYRFGFVEETDKRALSRLIKKCLAKHELGVNNPSQGEINKVPNSYLPIRKDDDISSEKG